MNTYHRRQFLKQFFIAAAATLPTAQRLLAHAPSEVIAPDWALLIDYARWCPTVHNLQPHKVKIISTTEAELYYDAERLLKHGDPNAVFATIALGIFHEHLSIAAAPHGFRVEMYDITGPVSVQKTGVCLFAKLRLVPSSAVEPLDRQLILERRTSRLHYDGRALPHTVCAQMAAEAARFGQEFFFSNDKNLVETMIDLNQKTLFDDLNSAENCAELDRLFRYSHQEAERQKDGLWAKCMNFPGKLVKSVFQNQAKWHSGLRHKILAKYYRNAFKGTSTLGWMGGNFEHTEDWLQAGRAFARVWLVLTREQAFLQPFGSLITNPNANAIIQKKFTQPSGNKQLWLVFRAGYSDEPARSYRLATSEIIL